MYKIGDRSRAICYVCQKVVRTTVKNYGCLVAVCNTCSSVASVIHPKNKKERKAYEDLYKKLGEK